MYRMLHKEIHAALDNLWLRWEVIYVDDGSTDGSVTLLEQLAETDPDYVSAVILRRNFGQTAAMAAGVDHARGEVSSSWMPTCKMIRRTSRNCWKS